MDVAVGDLWMSVHLGYLMVLADQLPGGLSIAPEPTNEERITEPICYQYRAYADQLVLEFNMLKEAMEYNMACPVNANAWNKQLLTRHGITSLGEKALKSIALFCRNNQLIFVDQFIYTTLGDRLFEQKKYLECVSPYAYAENSTALDMIAKILLDQYLKDGSLDQVVTDKEYTLALETSPAYSFLYNYKILRDFIQAEQLDQAYDKLWMLMGSLGFVNAEYSLVLLIDAFDVYLSAKAATRTDTLQLLHQLDIAVKDEAWPSFATNYYACHHNGKELAPDLIAEKLKQRFIYYLMQLA
ncbi:hypothetical protein DM01DRAFT_150722 [Hesseltinella vesiculosa]|uniref:Nuclear pore complex protein Nup85 n=1 Tax=Hesseltinella vesiculosa TaxID=101127 RepID=A0A1X2GU70_9FUNG|nr:hypothetical protein DM01DRAFT_150722 [Hesseltinella vesiculosa]